MESSEVLLFKFAVQNFGFHLFGVIIGIAIASFLIPRLFKNGFHSFIKIIAYSLFGAVGGILDYVDTTALSDEPVFELLCIFIAFFIGSFILTAPVVYYRARARAGKDLSTTTRAE